jgi:hypothetical protein
MRKSKNVCVRTTNTSISNKYPENVCARRPATRLSNSGTSSQRTLRHVCVINAKKRKKRTQRVRFGQHLGYIHNNALLRSFRCLVSRPLRTSPLAARSRRLIQSTICNNIALESIQETKTCVVDQLATITVLYQKKSVA